MLCLLGLSPSPSPPPDSAVSLLDSISWAALSGWGPTEEEPKLGVGVSERTDEVEKGEADLLSPELILLLALTPSSSELILRAACSRSRI